MAHDLAIIVPLKEEFGEVAQFLMPFADTLVDEQSGRSFYLFERASSEPEKVYRCVISFIGQMGLGGAHNLTALLRQRFHPRFIVLIGLAGSLSKDAKVGDVVVADSIDDFWAAARATPDGIDTGGKVYRPHVMLPNMIRNLQYSHPTVFDELTRCAQADARDLLGDHCVDLQNQEIMHLYSRILVGPIASGDIVIADPRSSTWLVQARDRKLLAVDMESAGVISEVHESGGKEQVLIIRGISDLCDERKTMLDQTRYGGLRKLAVRNATRLFLTLIEKGVFDPAKDSLAIATLGERTQASQKPCGDDPEKELNAVEEVLLHWLHEDQAHHGYRRGQYGLSADPHEGAIYEAPKSLDRQYAMPEVHLTGWPCFILSKHHLAPDQLELAYHGVQKLLKNGLVRALPKNQEESAWYDSTYLGPVSYRHAIRSAQILFHAGDSLNEVRQVLDLMFSSDWQAMDGGWKQYESSKSSDLYCSVYAAALIHATLSADLSILSTKQSSQAKACLASTLKFLAATWSQLRWAYESASPEQNAPQIFPEVAEVLHCHAPNLLAEIVEWLVDWVNDDIGLVKRAYFDGCYRITRSQAYTRFAYAFFVGGRRPNQWQPLYESAILFHDEGCNACDVAWLLDITRYLRNERCPPGQGRLANSAL